MLSSCFTMIGLASNSVFMIRKFPSISAASVDVDYVTDIPLQICYHRIKAIIHGFFPDTLLIQQEKLFLCGLYVISNCCFLNETGRIVRIFPFLALSEGCMIFMARSI